MEANEQTRFDTLYAQHLRALKLRGYSASTIDVYARSVHRLTDYFGCAPDQLSVEQLETYFAELVDTRSWALVRVDRNGLQFFWKFILKQDWQWVTIIKLRWTPFPRLSELHRQRFFLQCIHVMPHFDCSLVIATTSIFHGALEMLNK